MLSPTSNFKASKLYDEIIKEQADELSTAFNLYLYILSLYLYSKLPKSTINPPLQINQDLTT